MKKRILATALCLCMVLSLLPIPALAANPEPLCNGAHSSWTQWTQSDTLPTSAGKYVLANDVNLNDEWEVPSGGVTLCLNGHNIVQTDSKWYSRAINVGSNSLTLCDCKYGDANYAHTFDAPEAFGSGVTYTVYGGYITGSISSSDGAGIYVDDGTLEINGCNIVDNAIYFSNDGAGIYVATGTVTLKNATIAGNHSSKLGADGNKVFGAGVFGRGANSSITAENVQFIYNYASSSGGGIYSNGSIHLKNCRIENNEAYSLSGGMACYGSATIEDTVISNNHSRKVGGVYLADTAGITYPINNHKLTNVTIENNTSDASSSYCSGLRMSVANFTLSGKIVVQGNTVGGITKNTQLEPGTVIDASGLTADSKIGITYNGTIEGGTSVSITTANASDISGYFLLDDTSAGYEIQNGASNAVELVSKKPAFEQDGIVFDTEWNTDLSEDTVISQNENIVLTGDVKSSGTITIPSGTTVNLCLNGFKLNMASNKIIVESGATLNIYEADGATSGTISGSSSTGPVISSSGTVSVNGGTVQNSNSSGNAAYINGGTFTVDGGTVKKSGTGIGEGSAIKCEGGTMNVVSGTVDGGGCIAIEIIGSGNLPTVNISGGKVTNSSSRDYYQTINNRDGILTISGDAEISNTGAASALYITANNFSATMNISGGSISAANNAAVNIYDRGNGNKSVVNLSGSPSMSSNSYRGDIYFNVPSGSVIAAELNGTDYAGDALDLGINVSNSSMHGQVIVTGSTDLDKFSLLGNTYNYVLEASGGNLVLGKAHTHSWSTEWSYNETAHWHACTADGCTETDITAMYDYGLHTPENDDGDCTTAIVCSKCGYETTTAKTHDIEYTVQDNVITETCRNDGCDHSAMATITAPDETLTYDGTTAFNANVSYSSGWTSGNSFDISYERDGNPVNDTKDAGSYTASVTIGSKTAKVSYIVNKAEVNAPTILSKPYNGGNQKADITENDLYTVEENNGGMDVGDYYVMLKLKDSNNYKWKDTDSDTITLKFSITTGANEWTEEPSISGWTYGEPANEPMGEAKYGEVVFTYYDSSKSQLPGKPENAGAYYIKASVASDGDNYGAIESDYISFTIEKAKVTKPSADNTVFTYNGSEQTYTVAENSLYTISGTKRTEAGSQTVTISLVDKDNYQWNDNTTDDVEFTFKINPKEIIINWSEDTFTYNGSDQISGITASYKDISGEDVSLNVSVDGGQFKDYKEGGYTFTASFANGETNYKLPAVTDKTYHMNKANPEADDFTFTPPSNLSYDGSEKAVDVTAKDNTMGAITVKYYDENGDLVSGVPTEAGTCTVKIDIAEGTNFNGAVDFTSAEWTFTIAKAALEAEDFNFTPPAAEDLIYDGNVKAASVTAKYNTIGAIVVKYYDEAGSLVAGAPTEAGTYTVKIDVAEGTNFSGAENTTSAEWTFTIGKATPVPDTGTIEAERVKRGDNLSTAEITGVVRGLDGQPIPGKWTWKNDRTMTETGTFEETVVFTPDNTNYCSIEVGGITVEVRNPVDIYDIKIGDMENGKITSSPVKVSCGGMVTLIVTPYEGYELETLTVEDSKGVKVNVSDLGNGKFTFEMPASPVTVNAVFKEIGLDYDSCNGGENCPLSSYTDLDPKDWYHNGIHYCLDTGLMIGTESDKFSPDGTLTRAEAVTVLWRLENKPDASYTIDFDDVADGDWYSQAVLWAASEKIVEGYGNGFFGTDDAITREQLSTILYRYAKYKGYDTSVSKTDHTGAFSDASEISDWAYEAMQWACGTGLLEGDDGNLNPTGDTIRSEFATMMMRFIENIAK